MLAPCNHPKIRLPNGKITIKRASVPTEVSILLIFKGTRFYSVSRIGVINAKVR